MTDDQGRLPLEAAAAHEEMQYPRPATGRAGARAAGEEGANVAAIRRLADIRSRLLRDLDKARKAIAGNRGDNESLKKALSDVDKAIHAVTNLSDSRSDLDRVRQDLEERRDSAFRNRRQRLKEHANAANWHVTNMDSHDYVGCFKVSYNQERVIVEVGSETLCKFDEIDGTKLFAFLKDARAALDAVHFDPKVFFSVMKQAVSWAKAQGLRAHGRPEVVPIRKLYPVIVLVRQSKDDGFFQLPTQRKFSDYSTAQFVYDLARFNRQVWQPEMESLKFHSPNMIAIDRGDYFALPRLRGDGHIIQISAVEIARTGG